jgi:hypothetical protein
MLKPDFHIQYAHLDAEDYTQCRLLMEVTPNSFSYVILSVRGMRPLVIKHFQWEKANPGLIDDTLREVMFEDEFLSIAVNETFIVYNFPESSLVPEEFFSQDLNRPMTELIYGSVTRELILSEKIPWWELHNIYRIPPGVHRILQQKFTSARYWHFYSLQLKCHKMFTAKDEEQYFKTIFYTDKMVLLAFKLGQLQLAQTFAYMDAKDVAYYLLNASSQLKMSPEQVKMEVSGFIERQSALYNELQKYFLHVYFEKMEDNIKVTDELKEYPLHYFSSLLKMAVCV